MPHELLGFPPWLTEKSYSNLRESATHYSFRAILAPLLVVSSPVCSGQFSAVLRGAFCRPLGNPLLSGSLAWALQLLQPSRALCSVSSTKLHWALPGTSSASQPGCPSRAAAGQLQPLPQYVSHLSRATVICCLLSSVLNLALFYCLGEGGG